MGVQDSNFPGTAHPSPRWPARDIKSPIRLVDQVCPVWEHKGASTGVGKFRKYLKIASTIYKRRNSPNRVFA